MTKFDAAYRKHTSYWGAKPSGIVGTILKYTKEGTVLDLGAGEGRNTLFLAKHGFRVTAIDRSDVGVAKINKLASLQGLQVRAVVTDIIRSPYDRKYDVILAISTLNFLTRSHIGRVVMAMKNGTNPGGLNVVAVFTQDNPQKGFAYLFKKNELMSMYNHWDVLHYSEHMTPLEQHGGGKPHRHGVAEIIAKKPAKHE